MHCTLANSIVHRAGEMAQWGEVLASNTDNLLPPQDPLERTDSHGTHCTYTHSHTHKKLTCTKKIEISGWMVVSENPCSEVQFHDVCNVLSYG